MRLNGDFVGTTDSQTITNKTAVVESNTLRSTTPALGNILVDNGTKYVARTKGSAGMPLRVNSGGTDIEYNTLGVAGGGTGATTLTGVVVGSGTSAFTAKANPAGAFLDDSSAQNITGAKTFLHQTYLLRNRANTGSLTLQNPVFTGNKEMFQMASADFLVFVDANDSNKIKALAGDTFAKEFEHATDLGTVLSSIHSAMSSNGGTVRVKAGAYGWASKLAVTKAHFGLVAEKGATVTPTTGYADDVITVDKNDFLISDFFFDCTNMANGAGTWLKIASGAVNSDRPRVMRNYVKNAATSGIHVATSNCNGLWAVDNSIQSFAGPTGNGIHLVNSADHKIIHNHVGGYADSTNGSGIMFSGCANCECIDNEVFTNRVGIRIYLPGSIVCVANLVQNNTQHGIAITNDSATTYKKSIVSLNRIHDNGTATTNTYDGITFSITGAGLIDNLVCIGNTADPHTSAKQRYGINVNTNKLTNSTIAFNACAGNVSGAVNLGTYDSTLRCFGNAGDTIQPYLFEDFVNARVVSAPSDPASGFIRYYPKQVDSNNDGLFYKTKVNGAVVEVAV